MDREILKESRMEALYKLIYDLRPAGNIKVGLNESIKSVNNNTALIAVIAADAELACLSEPLPILCEQKGIQCVYVESKAALGKACHVKVDVLACTIYVNRNDSSSKITAQIAHALK